MAAGDWADTSYTLRPYLQMVDPWNNLIERGSMTNISKCSVTWGYDTDTIASASIETLGDDGYIDGSRIRVCYEVQEWGLRETVFTGYVETGTPTIVNGTRVNTYSLKSVLKVCEGHHLVYPMLVGAGNSAINGINHILTRAGYRLIFAPNCTDFLFHEPKIYNVGSESVLAVLKDLCELSGNRLNVSPDGAVLVERAINPSQMPAQWRLHDESTRGMIIEGTLKPSLAESSVPSRVIITASQGDDSIVGFAEVPPDSWANQGRRGYQLDHVETSSDISNMSQSAADAMAQKILQEKIDSIRDWAMDTLFFPGKIGDGVQLTVQGVMYATYIKNITFDLIERKCSVTLKEAF